MDANADGLEDDSAAGCRPSPGRYAEPHEASPGLRGGADGAGAPPHANQRKRAEGEPHAARDTLGDEALWGQKSEALWGAEEVRLFGEEVSAADADRGVVW